MAWRVACCVATASISRSSLRARWRNRGEVTWAAATLLLMTQAQADYDTGKVLFKLMNQSIGEIYSFAEQQFLMSIVLGSEPQEIINLEKLKERVHEYAAKLQEDKDMNGNFDELAAALKAEVMTIDEVKQKAIEKAAKAEAEKKRQAEEAAKAAEAEAASAEPPREGK